MGYRVALGEQFLTVYPVIQCSAKDELNPDKTVKKAATAEMVDARKASGMLGASVSTKFSKRFDLEVSWVKTDKAGNEVPDEQDITQGNDPATGGDSSDSSDNGSSGGGGNDDFGGNGLE